MTTFLILFLVLIAAISTAQANKLHDGAYLIKNDGINTLVLITDYYISISTYKDDTYINTFGGPFKLENKHLNIQVEYDDKTSNSVGQIKTIPIQSNKSQITLADQVLKKAENKTHDLNGLWRITDRKNGETMSTIPRSDRKTIKILTDGYFQWIAINPIEKSFYGTGGGKYTFQNGKYTETILFFSRDNTRVGNTLSFDDKVVDQHWHHNGKSSKEDPIYEIWSKE